MYGNINCKPNNTNNIKFAAMNFLDYIEKNLQSLAIIRQTFRKQSTCYLVV